MQRYRSVQVYLPSADDIDGQLAKVLAPFLIDEDGKRYTYRYDGGMNKQGSFNLMNGAPDITPDTHRCDDRDTNVALVSSVDWNDSWRYSDVLTLDGKWLKPHKPGLSRAKQGEANSKWWNGYVDRFVKTAPEGAVVVAVWMESAKDHTDYEFAMSYAWQTKGGASPEFHDAVRVYADAVYAEFGERPLGTDRVTNGGHSGMSRDQVDLYIADVYTVVRRIEKSYGNGIPTPLTDAGGRLLACSRCGSTAIEYVLPDPEGGNRYRHIVCLDCGTLSYNDDYMEDDGGRHRLGVVPVTAPVTLPPLPDRLCERVVLVPRTVIDAMVDMYLAARTADDLPSTMVVLDQVSGRAVLVAGDRAEEIAEEGEFHDYPQFLCWADDMVNATAADCCPAFPVALPGFPDVVALKQGFCGDGYRWTPRRRAALLEIRQLVDPAATVDEEAEAGDWWHSKEYLARMGEIDPAALAAHAAKWAPHAAEVFLTRDEIAAKICEWIYWIAGDVPCAHCVFEGVGSAFDRYAGLIEMQPERRRVCSTCGEEVDPDDEDAIIMPVDTPTGRVQRRFCGDECLALHIDTATPMEEA